MAMDTMDSAAMVVTMAWDTMVLLERGLPMLNLLRKPRLTPTTWEDTMAWAMAMDTMDSAAMVVTMAWDTMVLLERGLPMLNLLRKPRLTLTTREATMAWAMAMAMEDIMEAWATMEDTMA